MNVIRRVRFARDNAATIRPIRTGPVSAFLFFLLAGAGRPWRFHLGPLPFYARYRDWVAVNEIALQDEYGFVRGLLGGNEAPRIVDLGANIGLFSLSVLRAFPSAIVHSVEASPATYDILRRNVAINGRLSWRAYHAAMWSADGRVPFSDREQASTGHRVDVSMEPDRAPRVPALSLGTLLRERVGSDVDVLKLDIEGAEEAVLCADPSLLESVHSITVEIHPDRCDERRVLRLLRDSYPHVYRVAGRASSKALIVATREAVAGRALVPI